VNMGIRDRFDIESGCKLHDRCLNMSLAVHFLPSPVFQFWPIVSVSWECGTKWVCGLCVCPLLGRGPFIADVHSTDSSESMKLISV